MLTYNYTYPNYICHHGIKGMKWGIRRTPAQLGHKASPKHRDAKGRQDYASARISYLGVTGTNVYKTYQGIRNTYSIATSKKKK